MYLFYNSINWLHNGKLIDFSRPDFNKKDRTGALVVTLKAPMSEGRPMFKISNL